MVSLQAGLDALLGSNNAILKSAEIAEGSRVSVVWSDGSSSLYPMLMLRDCCPCEKCFSPIVNSRIILFEHIIGASCSVNCLNVQDGDLLIEWQDGHLSTYSSEWLYRRRLDQGAITDRLDKVYTGVMDQPWSSKIPSEIMKCANYDDIIGKPAGIVDLTENLIRDGVYLIKNAPDRQCLLEFMKGIGAKAQSTHYGDHNWTIKNNPNSKDLPNSSKKLELHIDMPYLEKPQQLQLLHCLVQSADGGENKLSDALLAALILKKENPEYYRLLSTVDVDFQFIKSRDGKDWFICNRAPVIQEHPKTGQPTLCRFAAEVRCSSFNQPIEVVEAWYDAFRRYWQILEENSILIKSAPGDIIVFNNGRVMHAREAFDTRQARELEGVYADWDYLLSAWRVAKVRMNQQG